MRLQHDQFASPLGALFLVHDQMGRLRVLDFDGHEERMRRLLHRHYGDVELAKGPAPCATIDALTRYFAGPFQRPGCYRDRHGWN